MLQKLVFVRRFIHLKQKVCNNNSTVLLKEWSSKLLKEVGGESSSSSPSSSDGGNDSDSTVDVGVFQDSIEPGEQGRINGQEPGEPPVTLTVLKKRPLCEVMVVRKILSRKFCPQETQKVLRRTLL